MPNSVSKFDITNEKSVQADTTGGGALTSRIELSVKRDRGAANFEVGAASARGPKEQIGKYAPSKPRYMQETTSSTRFKETLSQS